MYQRLRHLVVGQQTKDKASVHYVMIPQARKELIDEDIERSVARMQAVVELGRVVRDRKTMPVKYPLPEVVVIHKDQQVLDDVQSLSDYILDELYVKKLTLSTKKQDYGVMLRAEPDQDARFPAEGRLQRRDQGDQESHRRSPNRICQEWEDDAPGARHRARRRQNYVHF